MGDCGKTSALYRAKHRQLRYSHFSCCWRNAFLVIVESLRLEKTSKIIKSNHQPNTPMPAKPYSEVPHLHSF